MLVILSILGVSLLVLGFAIWAFIRHRRKAKAGASALTPQPTQASSKPDPALAKARNDAPTAAAPPSAEPAGAAPIRQAEANAATAVTANTERVPEDSVLRRHYDTSHKADSTSEQKADNPPIRTGTESAAPALAPAVEPGIPQDSVLRRHFLARLTHQIESELPVKPSDSVLRRHYETLVADKLQQYLSRMQSA